MREDIHLRLLSGAHVLIFHVGDGSVVEVRRVLIGWAIGDCVFSDAGQAANAVMSGLFQEGAALR